MLAKRVAASAAAVTLMLTGLGSAVATPAFADISGGSAKCNLPYKAAETVQIHADGGGAAPPRNLNESVAIGQLPKGKNACTAGPQQPGASYKVKGDCANGTSDLWEPIRIAGNKPANDGKSLGWVPASCNAERIATF
jgi:hypothetical protein